MGFNQIILDLRNYRGVSQKQVADSVGISQSTIAKIEIGRNEATASTIRKLADYFQVSADYLLERTDDFANEMTSKKISLPTLSPDEQEILTLYQSLRPSSKEDLKIYLRALSESSAPNTTKKKA